ncbi:hypothetical protein ACIQUQ_12425 [Streptomyces sp. NPDC101118]|uniref:hypothetical protein n=1 Tax=Streptomyces sp. NPDC101118 TaxID=3366109 RepID=UPI00380A34A6
MSVEKAEWEAAVRKLYGGTFAYVATGPRRHEDWRIDVLDVMRRAVGDPRGWAGLADCPEGYSEDGEEGPSYPFKELTPDVLGERLYAIEPEAAAEQLVAMAAPGCRLSNALPLFAEGLDELLGLARSLVSRHGEAPEFFTNVPQAYDDRHPDYDATFRTWHDLTVYVQDIGLVAVSDAEAGVYWTFAPEH